MHTICYVDLLVCPHPRHTYAHVCSLIRKFKLQQTFDENRVSRLEVAKDHKILDATGPAQPPRKQSARAASSSSMVFCEGSVSGVVKFFLQV